MNLDFLYNLENELYELFKKNYLLNLWNDSIKNLRLNTKDFFQYDCKEFTKKINYFNLKYNVYINLNEIKLFDNFWLIRIKDNYNKCFHSIKLNLKIWNYSLEKNKKYENLKQKFSDEIKKFNKIKRYLSNHKTKKVLIYPINNIKHPLYNLSKIINKYIFGSNKQIDILSPKKILKILKICSNENSKNYRLDSFYVFLTISESRFITKMRDEIIPFITNINLLKNNKHKIKEIFYFDSPDFIIKTINGAIGVEVTNIRKRNDYYKDKCNKENVLRKMINSNCFYSKKYILLKQRKNFAYKQGLNKINNDVHSVHRHFSNNKKYNELIRKNGLKVKRGEKTFYILNGWDKKIHIDEKRLIKNIAIKEKIPTSRLIFFTINEIKRQ